MPPLRSITVFEVANDELKEVYLTWTSRPIFEAMCDFGAAPPKLVSHWKTEKQHINFRSLEFDLTKELARDFISRHAAKQRQSGWKYILDV